MQSTILPSSTGWNSNDPTWIHSRAPWMLRPEPGHQREQQQDHAGGQQQVAVAVEVPGPPDHDQGDHVGGHAAGRPGGLERGVVRVVGWQVETWHRAWSIRAIIT